MKLFYSSENNFVKSIIFSFIALTLNSYWHEIGHAITAYILNYNFSFTLNKTTYYPNDGLVESMQDLSLSEIEDILNFNGAIISIGGVLLGSITSFICFIFYLLNLKNKYRLIFILGTIGFSRGVLIGLRYFALSILSSNKYYKLDEYKFCTYFGIDLNLFICSVFLLSSIFLLSLIYLEKYNYSKLGVIVGTALFSILFYSI